MAPTLFWREVVRSKRSLVGVGSFISEPAISALVCVVVLGTHLVAVDGA